MLLIDVEVNTEINNQTNLEWLPLGAGNGQSVGQMTAVLFSLILFQ